MRLPGWERRLTAVVEKHLALPSDYAVSNCYIIPDDGVEALLGERMHPKLYGGGRGPNTETGAAKRLRRFGFETVEDAFRARFAEIPPSLAQRGDIGVVIRDGVVSGGLFTSIGFMARSAAAPVFLGASDVARAFKVE